MAIPTFDKLLRPILEHAIRGPITRVVMTEAMMQHFALTQDGAEPMSSMRGS